MGQFLAFTVVGLSTAAIYAIIGSGLVLTYTTTGVFNFAHGAAGMLAAFTYWQLTIGWGWPIPVALAVVLFVLAPAFGLFVERVIMRPVQGLGEAERLVMTVALLSGLIAAARWIWNPNVPRSLPAFFPNAAPLHIGAATITWHQAITMMVAVAVAVSLRVLLHRTRTGAEMRATVDDRALAGLTGADPLRANRVAWILGTQLAALGGVLIAPALTLDATQLSLLIVSAYTAAVFGRLRSLPLTFAGAVVVGCMESYLTGYLPNNSFVPGLRLAAPALVLFVALLAFPHGRLRGRARRLSPVPVPTLRGTAVFCAVIIAFGVVLATVLSNADLITYGAIFSLGIVALSFVPLAGYAGEISLCQLSFAGIGAVVWGHLGAQGSLWALAVAIAVSAAAGALIALPALRLSGIYLALGTAAFATVLDQWIFTLPPFHVLGLQIALFDQGSVQVSGPRLFGLRLSSGAALMVCAAVCLALASLVVVVLRRSRFGRRLIALRDSEAAYATLGGNLLVAKVGVFALSAGIAGLGGVLYAMQQQSVTAGQFNLVAGLPIFLVAVIGGLAYVGDGLFTGTAYVAPLNAMVAIAPWSQNLAALLPALAGIGLGRNPDGLTPALRRDWEPVARHRIALSVAAVVVTLLWVLRLVHVINGWALFGGALAALLALRAYAAARPAPATAATAAGTDAAPSAGPDVPVEWWGVRRPWSAEDEEVMARGIAGG